jgi:hypothetical protein
MSQEIKYSPSREKIEDNFFTKSFKIVSTWLYELLIKPPLYHPSDYLKRKFNQIIIWVLIALFGLMIVYPML